MSRNREILYSVRSPGWRIEASQIRRHDLFDNHAPLPRRPRKPLGSLKLGDVTCNNLHQLYARLAFPLGISGSGKSSLVNQVLVKLVARQLGLSARQRESR
jgi:excinuclease ABC subunit A